MPTKTSTTVPQRIPIRALAEFRYTLRKFLHFSEEAAVSAGLTPQQHQALLAVAGFPEGETVSIGDLAERLKIRHHSAVGLVNRLVTEGLMERTPRTNDRRKVSLALTPRGNAILQTLSETHRDELRREGPHLVALLQSLITDTNSRANDLK